MSHYRMGLALPAPQEHLGFVRNYRSGLVYVGDGGIADTGMFADIQGELSQLNSEMMSLNTELFNQLPATTTDPKFQYYSAVWRPFAEEFQDFRDKLGGVSLANIARSLSPALGRGLWKDMQAYRGRLREMWAQAKDVGFKLTSPEPTAPKESAFGDIGGVFGKVWDFLRTLVYIAIGLGVGWLLLQVVREVRS